MKLLYTAAFVALLVYSFVVGYVIGEHKQRVKAASISVDCLLINQVDKHKVMKKRINKSNDNLGKNNIKGVGEGV